MVFFWKDVKSIVFVLFFFLNKDNLKKNLQSGFIFGLQSPLEKKHGPFRCVFLTLCHIHEKLTMSSSDSCRQPYFIFIYAFLHVKELKQTDDKMVSN